VFSASHEVPSCADTFFLALLSVRLEYFQQPVLRIPYYLSVYHSLTDEIALKSSYAFLNCSSSKRIRKRNIKICIETTRTIAGRLSVTGCLTVELQLLHSGTKYIEH
jgi:hypothetical protein